MGVRGEWVGVEVVRDRTREREGGRKEVREAGRESRGRETEI